jgi:hypothetical protein
MTPAFPRYNFLLKTKTMKIKLLSLLFIFLPLVMLADSAPIIPVQSGCVKPVNNYDIILKSEVVNIYLYQDYYDVEVNYIFVNTGEAMKILMGFPNQYTKPGTTQTIENFKAYDSTALLPTWKLTAWDTAKAFQEMKNKKLSPSEFFETYFNFYECFQVSFEKGQRKRIKNTYRQEYVTNYMDTILSAKYILTTGALWKDDIDSISINIIPRGIPFHYLAGRKAYFDEFYGKASPVTFNGILFKPANPEKNDSSYHFLFTDTEPDFNIGFSMPQKFIYYSGASSELTSDGKYTYSVKNLTDNDPHTAWAEGKEGGTGDTIQIHFSPHIRWATGSYLVNKIGIINGLAYDSNYFYSNNRVKKIKLIYTEDKPQSERTSSQKEYILEDKMEMQYIEFPPSTFMSQVQIIIEEVYKGSKYDDTCISEIQFFIENQ